MGYYFRLKQAKFDENIGLGTSPRVDLDFRNDGVAPIYEPCHVLVEFLDGEGRPVATTVTDIDPGSWLPGTTATESVTLDTEGLTAGEYRLAVGLFRSPTDADPTYLIGSEGKTPDNRYVFGTVTVS